MRRETPEEAWARGEVEGHLQTQAINSFIRSGGLEAFVILCWSPVILLFFVLRWVYQKNKIMGRIATLTVCYAIMLGNFKDEVATINIPLIYERMSAVEKSVEKSTYAYIDSLLRRR